LTHIITPLYFSEIDPATGPARSGSVYEVGGHTTVMVTPEMMREKAMELFAKDFY
jgi:hypothetical protein